MSHDDDDNEEDFAASFRRLVRATEKQIALAEAERHKVYGFEIEVSATEMRSLLIEHAKLLRAKLDFYKDMISGDELTAYAHDLPVGGPETPLPPPPKSKKQLWKPGDPIQPHASTIGQMELQAVWCIAWAAKLTDERKVFRLHTSEWGLIFGRPDVALGHPL